MDLEINTLSQKEKDKYQIPYDVTYMWSLNTVHMNISMKQKETQMENKLVTFKGEGRTGNLGLADVNYYM